MSTFVRNSGSLVIGTDYWQTDHAKQGLLYLTTNAGCMRLLVPASQRDLLDDMQRGVREVVLTRGKLEGRDSVEVMFEDGSDSPFCVHLDQRQLDRVWTRGDENKPVKFAVYRPGQEPESVDQVCALTCYLRSAARLPYARAYDGPR